MSAFYAIGNRITRSSKWQKRSLSGTERKRRPLPVRPRRCADRPAGGAARCLAPVPQLRRSDARTGRPALRLPSLHLAGESVLDPARGSIRARVPSDRAQSGPGRGGIGEPEDRGQWPVLREPNPGLPVDAHRSLDSTRAAPGTHEPGDTALAYSILRRHRKARAHDRTTRAGQGGAPASSLRRVGPLDAGARRLDRRGEPSHRESRGSKVPQYLADLRRFTCRRAS